MASRDFSFLSLRPPMVAYQANGLPVQGNTVLITSTNGAATFSNSINVSSVSVSTLNSNYISSNTISTNTIDVDFINAGVISSFTHLTSTITASAINASSISTGYLESNKVLINGPTFNSWDTPTLAVNNTISIVGNTAAASQLYLHNGKSRLGTSDPYGGLYLEASTPQAIYFTSLQAAEVYGSVGPGGASFNGSVNVASSLNTTTISTLTLSVRNRIDLLSTAATAPLELTWNSGFLFIDGHPVATDGTVSTVSSVFWQDGAAGNIVNKNVGTGTEKYLVGVGYNTSENINATLDVKYIGTGPGNVFNVSSNNNRLTMDSNGVVFITNSLSTNTIQMDNGIINSISGDITINPQATLDVNGDLQILGNTTINSTLTTNYGMTNKNSGIRLVDGFSNNASRPPLRPTSEISSFIIHGSGQSVSGDDGFLQLSAGGGTNSTTISYIQLSGFSDTTTTTPPNNFDMYQNIVFGTSGTERMRLISNGNLGINTANPSTNLQIDGTFQVNNNGEFQPFRSASNGNYIYVDNGSDANNTRLGAYKISTTSNEPINLCLQTNTSGASVGRLGVGKLNPFVTLDVNGDIQASGYLSTNTINMNNGTIGFDTAVNINPLTGAGGNINIGTANNPLITLGSSGSNQTHQINGNLAVGSPIARNNFLNIYNTSSISGAPYNTTTSLTMSTSRGYYQWWLTNNEATGGSDGLIQDHLQLYSYFPGASSIMDIASVGDITFSKNLNVLGNLNVNGTAISRVSVSTINNNSPNLPDFAGKYCFVTYNNAVYNITGFKPEDGTVIVFKNATPTTISIIDSVGSNSIVPSKTLSFVFTFALDAVNGGWYSL